MIAAVARKELREISRDGRFRWMAVACSVLIIIAALSGLQVTLNQARDHAAASSAERANFDDQGAKNPHAAAHFGQYAFRPILLPAAIDPGVSAYMGSMVWLEAHRMNLPEFRPAEDAAGVGRAGRLSVAWVMQFILPLLVIVITFGSIAGERERGTLALTLSQGMSMPRLLLGKAAGALSALLIIIGPLVVLCVALFAWAAPSVTEHGGLSRLGWMMGGYLLYLVGFAGLSLWVSTISTHRRNAFFALIALWLAITVMIPRIAADVAVTVHPTPPATEFWAAIKRGESAGTSVAEDPRARISAIRERTLNQQLAQYDVATPAELPINFTAVFLQALEEADAPIFDFNFGKLWGIYESQRQVQRYASLLSPAIAVRAVSAAMAGADPYAQRHFTLAAENHRRQFVAQLNEIQAIEGAKSRFYVAAGDKWQSVPALHYDPPETGDVLARHLPDLALLLGWAVIPFGLGLMASHRARALA